MEISNKLDGYRKHVLFDPGLLDELGSIITSGKLNAAPNSPEFPSGKRKQQQKNTKRKVQRINVDVFKKAERSVPESQEKAEVLAREILNDLRIVLQVSFLSPSIPICTAYSRVTGIPFNRIEPRIHTNLPGRLSSPRSTSGISLHNGPGQWTRSGVFRYRRSPS